MEAASSSPLVTESDRRCFRPTRRQVLGGAAVGGVAAGAARLLGLGEAQIVAIEKALGANPGAKGIDWISPLASERAQVAHLLRRSSFGIASATLEASAAEGYAATVERLLNAPQDPPPPFSTFTSSGDLNLVALQEWWLAQMLASQSPLIERMTLFWHGHFTSDYQKVTLATPFLYWQNLTWRQMALQDFPGLVSRVTVDPAMLRYLDLGTSVGSAPNENYARELMELFTIGVGHYTEDDVRAMAKALTGWTFPPPDSVKQVALGSSGASRRVPVYDSPKTGVFVTRRAYQGPPFRLLGRADRWDTDRALAQLIAQPSLAPFIAEKVVQSFVSVRPPAGYVDRLAAAFKASGFSIRELMRQIFMSPEFLQAPSYRALVKAPTEFMLSVLMALKAPQLVPLAAASGADMGQELFNPPNVSGWPHNDAWISSNNVISRVNFVTAVLSRLKALPPVSGILDQLDSTVGPATAAALDAASDDRARWLVALVAPEFNLK